MGLLDDVTSAVNRGTAAAGRTGRVARLRMQLSELSRRRSETAAQLGASLYEATRDMPDMRAGREVLYDAIAQIDEQCAQVKAQIEAVELEARAAQEAARAYVCPRCGTRVYGSQGFCSGCGIPVADIRSSAGAVSVESELEPRLTCVWCGAPIEEDDVFCMSCGARQSKDGVSE